MKKMLMAFGFVLLALGAGGEEVSFAPGVSFDGSPSYVSEFATQFRDNGGPLSPYGSHFGLKAEAREKGFAGGLHFACATGKNILAYSRTGLAGRSWVSFRVGGREFSEAAERKIHFEYFGWEEEAKYEGFTARARVSFLGLDEYLISVRVRNTGSALLNLTPDLSFEKAGKKFSLMETKMPQGAVFKLAVQPTITAGESYLAVLSSHECDFYRTPKRNGFFNVCKGLSLKPGDEAEFSYIFEYSLDSPEDALNRAQQASQRFKGADESWQAM